jgi:isocitrate dehydrogenase
LALAVSLEHLAERFSNAKAKVLADALDAANTKYLMENKAPSRKVNELDNRGTHYYLGWYWAEALAAQTVDAELAKHFAPVAKALADNEAKIIAELSAAQGAPVELGGYYHPSDDLVFKAMRPSATLNQIIDNA